MQCVLIRKCKANEIYSYFIEMRFTVFSLYFLHIETVGN